MSYLKLTVRVSISNFVFAPAVLFLRYLGRERRDAAVSSAQHRMRSQVDGLSELARCQPAAARMRSVITVIAAPV